MKKIVIIAFIILLSGCEKMSILNTVYISSIGIDYVDDEFVGYFYSPPTRDIGKDNNSDDDATVYILKEKELSNLFDNMFDSNPANINMHHLKSMILSDDFIDIDLLLDYFKYSTKVSYNFHVFITEDQLSDIYKYKSMSNISNLYNFINSPSLIDYEEHGITKCHFLNFADNYLNEYRYNMIPLVEIEYNSIKEEEFQLKLAGYSNTEYIYRNDDYSGIKFLFSSDKEVSSNNEVVLLYDYDISYNKYNDIFTISIEYKKKNISGNLNIKEYILNELEMYFKKVIEQENSIYLIDQYNYLYNKNLNNKNYGISITEK